MPVSVQSIPPQILILPQILWAGMNLEEKTIQRRESDQLGSESTYINVKIEHARPSKSSATIITEVLGERALNRFSELRNIQAGWNFGEGSPMSAGAEANFIFLLSKFQTNSIQSPRLFLMDDGGIEIQWENQSNRRVSVVVTENSFELSGQGHGEELFNVTQYKDLLDAALSDHASA
jgi:hypothetical protein